MLTTRSVAVRDKIYEVAVEEMQIVINHTVHWGTNWKIRMNNAKSVRVDFALRKHGYNSTYIQCKPIPMANSAYYLGLYLDNQLRKFQCLRGRYSKLSLANKCLVYTMIFLPV